MQISEHKARTFNYGFISVSLDVERVYNQIRVLHSFFAHHGVRHTVRNHPYTLCIALCSMYAIL